MEEVVAESIEEIGLFEVERMPGVGQYHQSRALDVPLHQDAGFEAGVVLVAGRDQGRHVELFHIVDEIPQRWPARLYAAHRVGRAERRMLR